MSLNAAIKVYSDLGEVYVDSSLPSQRSRWLDGVAQFSDKFGGAKPIAVARAPGRTNLIGDHVDYCLFGVIPSAVEMDTLICFGSAETSAAAPYSTPAESNSFHLQLANTDSRWPGTTLVFERPESSSNEWSCVKGQEDKGWVSYVRASMETLLQQLGPSFKPRSLNMLVSGNVPAGSGLSSSAALIVASLIAILSGNGVISIASSSQSDSTASPSIKPPNASELVQLARDSEARMGVNTGGMDQAISVLAQRGTGTYVTFWPTLGVESIDLPEGLVLVIANSLATHNLAADAKRHYNLRVVETLAAARLLAAGLELDVQSILAGDSPQSNERFTLREVAEAYGRRELGKSDRLSEEDLERTLHSLLKQLDSVFDSLEHGHTPEEMIRGSKLEQEEFKRLHFHIDVLTDEQDGKYRLLKRARHVYTESIRVLEFRRECAAGQPNPQRLGELMDQAHASIQRDFESSKEECDELVEVCRRSGALGSRLSGGGWGGCVVSLVERPKQDAFIDAVKAEFSKYAGQSDLSQTIFPSAPGSGAGVFVGQLKA